jgi:hypothetical protein
MLTCPTCGTEQRALSEEEWQSRENSWHARRADLENCLEEVAEECADEFDASVEADGTTRVNKFGKLYLRIREVMPR